MEYYLMTRNGEFVPHKKTPNQCKVEGHPAYNYSLRMVFPKTTKLDEHGFIIDHAFIDNMIHKLKLEGSCEEMHHVICGAVQRLFVGAGVELSGCRCSIIPDMHIGDAYMDYIYITDNAVGTQQIIISSLLN